MAPRRLIVFAFAATALAACAEDPPGIIVSVDLAEFAPRTANLKVAISASPDGFKPHPRDSVDGVGVETEDIDGDGTLELVAHFLAPRSPVSFRVATGNLADLVVRGQAIAFDTEKIIAGADGVDTALPAGGRGSIALALTERTPGIVGPGTRTTDVLTANPDVKVGTNGNAHLSSVVLCDLDGDGAQDIVIGAADAQDVGLVVGGVYVVRGGNLAAEIDLEKPQTAMGFRFFGRQAGDRLGAAVTCADLNGDNAIDLIVGAPGAAAVYAVFGGQDIATRTIQPGTTGAGRPSVTWQGAPGSDFGAALFAGDIGGDTTTEIMVSEPLSKKVHLFTGVRQAVATPIDVATAAHPTFINIRATAMAGGNLARTSKTDVADVILGDSDAKMPNATVSSGAIYGFASVPLTGAAQLDALAPTTVMYGAPKMQFGAAALAINTTGPGVDLIIGAPGDGDGAGAFYVYEGDDAFFSAPVRNYGGDETKRVVPGPIANGRFGAALAATASASGGWDLVVGAPGTGRGSERAAAGAAYLFGGRAGWTFPLYEVLYGAGAGHQLGAVVTGGLANSNMIGDLVTLAPGAGLAGNGVIYVLFTRNPLAP